LARISYLTDVTHLTYELSAVSREPNNPLVPRVLIADDQPAVREALRILLVKEGYQVLLAALPKDVLQTIKSDDVSLVLLDLNYARDTTSGQEGLELIGQIKRLEGAPPIVVMTAWATIDLAVAAMQSGARDFIQKPWENARVIAIVRTQLDFAAAEQRGRRLESENQVLRSDAGLITSQKMAHPSDFLIARSPAMNAVVETIQRVAPSDANVLITGENGTGKGVVARAIHEASQRADKAFVTVNMGGINENLFESELFGHMKGAFTDAKTDRAGRFEIADTGTLFLDEIGNIPLSQQAKLLRTIETGEFERVGSSKTRRVNVRLISATNADLPDEVEAGRFRRDLYFRLRTVELQIPPLRDRPEDILALAQHFLDRHAQRYNKQFGGIDSAAQKALLFHRWPGNVRELDHTIERAVLMADAGQIRPADLGLGDGNGQAGSTGVRLEDMTLEEIEKALIKKALNRYGGNARRAAEALGLSRSTFYRRLQQYGL
jgi:DNA-binding NtrC family response regulator